MSRRRNAAQERGGEAFGLIIMHLIKMKRPSKAQPPGRKRQAGKAQSEQGELQRAGRVTHPGGRVAHHERWGDNCPDLLKEWQLIRWGG